MGIALNIFVIVIPKEESADTARQFFFGYDINYEIVLTVWIGGAPTANPSFGMLYQKKDCWDPAHQSFFWYDNDKDLKARFPMTRLT